MGIWKTHPNKINRKHHARIRVIHYASEDDKLTLCKMPFDHDADEIDIENRRMCLSCEYIDRQGGLHG